MSNREIDAAVATAMGYEVTPAKKVHLTDERIEYHSAKMEWHSTRLDYIGELPHYSSDISASRAMEDWLAEYGFKYEYVQVLKQLLAETMTLCSSEHMLWALIYATPLQRCLALLRTMGVEVGE